MADVVLRGVSRVFPDGTVAVDAVDLSIPDGQFMVLVGPSGCGKSTTLRMIAGLDQATDGEISIGGRVVNSLLPKDRDIAMVFQNYALYPHMTVRQNLSFALRLRQGGLLKRLWQRVASSKSGNDGVSAKDIELKVRTVAAKLGIEHLLERRPRELSGGERQRVALGRALVREPVAYLFDEPLSNLDARLRLDMRRELKQLHNELGSTMIYVTHDQVEALTLGDQIAVMQSGRIQQVGSPQEVYERPRNRFVAGFIGSPPMNFLEAEVQGDGTQVAFTRSEGTVAVDRLATEKVQRGVGDRLVVGFRPESVQVARPSAGSDGGVPAMVALVEPLGDATIVHVQLGKKTDGLGATVMCKVAPETRFDPGERVELKLDRSRIHYFDPETGQNLEYADGN